MYPSERFTQGARRVLALAQEEAERSHHSYIGTEHLLLGLLREEHGRGGRVLARLGVGIEPVRATIQRVLGQNERIIVQQIIPTSRVKKVIEIAFEEAKRQGETYVGSEHLLLGLVLEGEGIAAHVLEDMGADLARIRAEIQGLEPIGHDRQPAPAPTSEVPWEAVVRVHDALHNRTNPAARQISVLGYRETPSAAILPDGWRIRIGAAAWSALALAEEEAVRCSATEVGTEHLLAGLLRQGEGRAASALAALDVDLAALRREFAGAVGGSEGSPPGHSFSHYLVQAVQVALESAARLSRQWADTGDLLVAILHPGSGASMLLNHLQVDQEHLAAEVGKVLDQEPGG